MSRWVVIAGCSYETGALLSRRVPTITQLCARHRWLGPLVLGALAVHFYRHPVN